MHAFIGLPLEGMSQIFAEGLKIVSQPGVNPIVALANMGNMYINFAGNLWIYILQVSIYTALIPLVLVRHFCTHYHLYAFGISLAWGDVRSGNFNRFFISPCCPI